MTKSVPVGSSNSKIITLIKKKKKLGIKLPHDTAIPSLSIYPEKVITENDPCTPVFTEALFTKHCSCLQ